MKIIIRKHGQFFREVDFSGSELVLGRSIETDVQLLHEDVSRKHVKISRKANRVVIEDLGSKNGTIYQGQSIQKSTIREGEIFSIGPFSISIESTAPQFQNTVVEHSLDPESTTSDFHENTGATNTSNSIKPDELHSASDEDELANKDDDSFLSAIAVSKKNKEDSEAEMESSPTMKEIIEYSKPTDPYKSIPEYLIEVKKRQKDKTKKPSEKPDAKPENDDNNLFKTQPTKPYSDIPEYLKEAEKKESLGKSSGKKVKKAPSNEPNTPSVEKFNNRHDIENEEQIKTEIRPPESTMERSLKDFPSMPEDSETPESEQFFLNREIDEEGIKETFENFPDTNKIKGSNDLESSFSMAAEGEIEHEDEAFSTDPFLSESDDHPSDAIPTESFTSQEKNIPEPEEDQIKTFMINAKDLPNDLHEKTDEFSEPKKSNLSRLFQKTTLIKPAVQKILKNPKKKKIIFITSALLLGIFILFIMDDGRLFHREPVDPETAINSEEGFGKLRKSEKKRVIAYQMDQIQKLINNKQIEESDARMK
jgi:pSer/pThr/pTyr-binding forkhead associated (FHA) protein